MSLARDFFLRDAVKVAEDLIGCKINRYIDGDILSLQIVETEAYCGPEDKACHAYNNKLTERTEPMFKKGGHVYVYLIYGMYHCFNIVTAAEGIPQAVLLRAGEPVRGKQLMQTNRDLKSAQDCDLASGPGKLCQALKINKDLSGLDLIDYDQIEIISSPRGDFSVDSGPRINIDYAEEYTDKPWRFYMPESDCLSN